MASKSLTYKKIDYEIMKTIVFFIFHFFKHLSCPYTNEKLTNAVFFQVDTCNQCFLQAEK